MLCRGSGRRPDLDQVLYLEAAAAQQPDHVAVAEVELHRLVVWPFEAVHAEVGPQQLLGGGQVSLVGDREHELYRVDQEDQPPAGAQQPGRLRDPSVRIAPDAGPVFRDHQVEGGIGERGLLGAGVQQREPQPEALLQLARGGQLRRGDIQADRTRPAPGQPGRNVAGAAAELDHVEPGQARRQDSDLCLGNGPDAPGRLGRGPVTQAGVRVPGGPAIPGRPVALNMIRHPGHNVRVLAVRPGVNAPARYRSSAVTHFCGPAGLAAARTPSASSADRVRWMRSRPAGWSSPVPAIRSSWATSGSQNPSTSSRTTGLLCSPSWDQVATSASSSSVPSPPGRATKASDRSYISCLRSCIDPTSCSVVRPVWATSRANRPAGMTPMTRPPQPRAASATSPMSPTLPP